MWDDYRYYEDKWVCPECLDETNLQAYIRDKATGQECSYCEKTFDAPSCIDLSTLADYLTECLSLELSSPEDSGLMWVGREGGWQGSIYETQNILAGYDYPAFDCRLWESLQMCKLYRCYQRLFFGKEQ